MPVQIIAGDIRNVDAAEFKTVLDSAGITRIDTAARYMNGASERKIGDGQLGSSFTIDTKILVSEPREGTLSREAIEKSASNSLQALRMFQVNVLYLHAPETETPLAVQARAFDEQYRKGRYELLGISNMKPDMLEQWFEITNDEGLIKPTVYQGHYNLLCRGYEEKLFPLLREHGMVFNAYSPLAGGFLLGNFTPEGLQAGQRFAGQGNYKNRFDRPDMHQAVARLKAISKETGLGLDELSLRWLMHHSILGDGDGIIIGGSKASHFERSAVAAQKGPLDEEVAQQLNGLWDICKESGKAIVE